MLDEWLDEKLNDRSQKGLMRSLPRIQNLVDFTSNDYLGLSRNEELSDKIRETLGRLPKRNGSTGSRLLSGNSELATTVESNLAEIFKSQATLLFNSGYFANLAVLSSVPQKNDTIIYDELAHASIKDGARLSLAKKFSFRHNDLADLEKKISASKGRVFVVVESLYSMDGDECPLEDLVKLSEKYGFSIVLDEAHTTGIAGPLGAGLSVEKSLSNKIEIRIYTFGKGMGVCGACVAGSEKLISYLINFARPFIYTTAQTQYTVASIGCAFEFLSENMHLQNILEEKVRTFLEIAAASPNRTRSLSAIQTCLIPGNKEVREAARIVQQKGFDVRPILSPTVPQGKERIRLCLHTFNTNEEIRSLARILSTL